MNIKNPRDLWSGLIFIAIGLAFAIGAREFSFGTPTRPGPGYFPFGLGLLLALVGAIIAVRSLLVAAAHGGRVGAIAWRPLLLLVGALVLFAVLLPLAGLCVALPVLVLVAAWAGDEFRLQEALASAVILTAGSWLVFVRGLGLALPLLPPAWAG